MILTQTRQFTTAISDIEDTIFVLTRMKLVNVCAPGAVQTKSDYNKIIRPMEILEWVDDGFDFKQIEFICFHIDLI